MKKKKQKIGKTKQNMKNNESKFVSKFQKFQSAMIEANYWRSKGYNTKTRKNKDGSTSLFKSKNKVK